MDFIDLHVHSSCSDGTLSPAQVTSLAAQNGLRAIHVTLDFSGCYSSVGCPGCGFTRT